MEGSKWCVVTQPRLFPELFFLERACRAHRWVVMQEAAYDRKETRFSLREDGSLLLSPENDGRQGMPLREVQLKDPAGAARKVFLSVQMAYGKQKPYRALRDSFEALMTRLATNASVASWCEASRCWMLRELDVQQPVTTWSMRWERGRDPSEQILDECLRLEATDYLSGATGINSYLNLRLFEKAGVGVWSQAWGNPFLPAGACLLRRSGLHEMFTQPLQAVRSAIGADEPKGNVGSARRAR